VRPRRGARERGGEVPPPPFPSQADALPALERAGAHAEARACLEAVTLRVEAALGLDFARGSRDETLTRTLSLVDAGGFVHRHTDAYGLARSGASATFATRTVGEAPSKTRRHLRANVALQLAHCPSLRPIIDRRPVDLDDGDAWAFYASEFEHETAVNEASDPRVVIGFGWALAA